MLSNDLFSYLDSDEHSALSASPVFPEAVLWQETDNLAETLFDSHGLECVSILNTEEGEARPDFTELTNPAKRSLCKNQRGKGPQKVIEINMGSDQEDELVKYLTGDYEETAPPCLKLVRRADEEKNSRSSPSSLSDGDRESLGGLCMSKNAVAARETRQRKKEYLENLENAVELLKSENKDLKSETGKMKTSIQELNEEVSYLKSVLANQTVLSSLLQNIQNTPGVRFHSSLSFNQNAAKVRPKKPTATVTGTVKTKPLKRKNCDLNTLRKSDVERPKTSKRLCNDHGYAAEPQGAHASQGDWCVETEIVDQDVCETSHSCEVDVNSSGNSTVSGGGVCLHVSNGSVSLEFCASCSEKASNVQNQIQLRSGRNK